MRIPRLCHKHLAVVVTKMHLLLLQTVLCLNAGAKTIMLFQLSACVLQQGRNFNKAHMSTLHFSSSSLNQEQDL